MTNIHGAATPHEPAPSAPTTQADARVTDVLDIDALDSHPDQNTFYSKVSPEDDERLRVAIEHEGQRDAIVVVPLDTRNGDDLRYRIIDGHRRVAVLRRLGATQIRAVVRRDLDDAAARMMFLDINRNRRQLTPMAIARIEVEKARIEHEKARRERRRFDFRAACLDRISQSMTCSEKSAMRYLSILTGTPLEVQHAVERGLMKLAVAPRFAWIPDADKSKLAAELRGLDTAKAVEAVVLKHLPRSRRRGAQASPGGKFLRAALRAVTAIGTDGVVPGYIAAKHAAELEAAAATLKTLAARGRDAFARQAAAIQEIATVAAEEDDLARAFDLPDKPTSVAAADPV